MNRSWGLKHHLNELEHKQDNCTFSVQKLYLCEWAFQKQIIKQIIMRQVQYILCYIKFLFKLMNPQSVMDFMLMALDLMKCPLIFITIRDKVNTRKYPKDLMVYKKPKCDVNYYQDIKHEFIRIVLFAHLQEGAPVVEGQPHLHLGHVKVTSKLVLALNHLIILYWRG